MDTLKSNLNVDMVASSSGYHSPMSDEVRNRLRKIRGTKGPEAPLFQGRFAPSELLFSCIIHKQ